LHHFNSFCQMAAMHLSGQQEPSQWNQHPVESLLGVTPLEAKEKYNAKPL